MKKTKVVALPKDIDYSKIGVRIRKARKKAGLTQEKIAVKCDCTSNHLSNVEVGKSKPLLELQVKLAMELNTSVDDFLMETPYISSQYLLYTQIGPKMDFCTAENLPYIEQFVDNFLHYKETISVLYGFA